MDALSQILPQVIKDPKVIITTVVIFLYIDIVCAIIRYRKKTKVIKPKVSFSAPAENTENKSEENKEDEAAEE